MKFSSNRDHPGQEKTFSTANHIDGAHLSCEEASLVKKILENPAARNPMTELARYLENTGKVEESKIVYRGKLPPTLQDRHKLDPYPREHSTDNSSCTRLTWYAEEMYPLRPPTNVDKNRNTIFNESTVTTKPECIDLMQACTIIYDGKNRLFVDKNGVRVSDYSTMNGFLLTKRCQNKSNLQHIRGVSLMLCAHNSNNFYHWHFDLLPKLCMAQSAGIKISDIDNFIIDKRDNGFQVETLLAAGVKAEQIRFVDIDNCHLFCDEILLIKIYNNQGMTQSRRHIDWIRSSFLKIQLYSGKKTLDTQNKIAIKRETRGFANAELVYKKLQDKGYTCIQPENLTYKEQVTLFSNATHIVAPHGAALSLIAYCKPNTIVHEYYGSHVQPCFWSIASTLGLDYHNYNCSDITDKDTIRNNKNLSIRLSENINATADQIDLICD